MKIVQYPHPALRHPCKPLSAIDKDVHLHAGRMLELMVEAQGLGLAAPQVALPYQMFVLNFPALKAEAEPKEPPGPECVFINPVILEKKGGTVEGEEGCLSFPGLYQKVRRAKTVVVQAYNLKGEAVEVTASDLASRLWQHEVDHLHGILFIDKMGPIARLASRSALKDFERDFRRAQERGEIPPDDVLKKEFPPL
jgi:peptide deformylase